MTKLHVLATQWNKLFYEQQGINEKEKRELKEEVKKITSLNKFFSYAKIIREKREKRKEMRATVPVKIFYKLNYYKTFKKMELGSADCITPKVRNNTHYGKAEPTTKIKEHFKIESYTERYLGKWAGSTYSVYYYLIASAYKISPLGRKCTFLVGEKEYVVKAPRGWKFAEKNGICIQKKKNKDIDFHFDYTTLEEHIKENGKIKISYFTRQANNNYKTRKQKEREENAIVKINLKDVYVFKADSIRGGNCRVGTENFIKQNSLQDKKYIRADVLEKINGTRRVSYAIYAAKKRTYLENKQGFCDLKITRF